MTRTRDEATPGMALLLACTIPLAVLSQFYRSSTGVIAPELAAEFGLTTEEIGFVSGAFFIAIAVLQLPVGILLDRFGAHRVITATMTIAVAGSVAFALAGSFAGLVLARVLIATGFAAVTIGSVVILRNRLPPAELAASMSILFAAANGGSLVATAPLAHAAASLGWRETFLALAVLSALAAAAFYLLLRDRAKTAAPAPAEPFLATAAGVLEVLRLPAIRRVAPLIAVGYASVIAVVGLWGAPYLHDVHGLGTTARGDALSWMAAALVVGTLAYGPLEKRLGNRRRLVTVGCLASAAALLALAAWPHPGTAAATALLSLFAFCSGFSVLVMAHGMALLPQRLAGRGATTLNIALLGGAALVQGVSGTLLEAAAAAAGAEFSYKALFALLAAVLTAALLCYRRIERRGRGAADPLENPAAEAAE